MVNVTVNAVGGSGGSALASDNTLYLAGGNGA
jgi:hypothetical protein